MVKRILLLLLFPCLLMTLLVGCGNTPLSNTPTKQHTTLTPTPHVTSAPAKLSPAKLAPTATATHPLLIAFRITKIDMSVNPTSIAGLACSSYITVVYTATFHAVPNNSGGSVQFLYTWNGGRASPNASITFAPGEITKTFSFRWSGNLPVDHTYPGLGGVIATSPNATGVQSPMVKPAGRCVPEQPLQITHIELSVTPSSIEEMTCGSSVTFIYTATFHAVPDSAGGTVQFLYTWNDGHASPSAKITFAPGEIIKTFIFSVKEPLYPHTYMGIAEVLTTSPNAVNSSQVHPTGSCD